MSEKPAIDVSPAAVAERLAWMRDDRVALSEPVTADMLEALAADRDKWRGMVRAFDPAHFEFMDEETMRGRARQLDDCLIVENTLVDRLGEPASGENIGEFILGRIERLRTFVRSARPIVQAYATKNPKFAHGGHPQDPMGAHAWLEAEAEEVVTMRDGGDPKVTK